MLPRYRGASPVAAAILAGDETSGVTLMRMEPGLDTGPIIAAAEEPIQPDETTERLTARLAAIGGDLTVASLPLLAAGELVPVDQPTDDASLTRPLTKADGRLDWRESADALERRVRAMWPWPRAWTPFDDDIMQIDRASVVEVGAGLVPGRVLVDGRSLIVACGADGLSLDLVQPAGGRPMSGAALRAGRRDIPTQLTADGEPAAPLVIDVGGRIVGRGRHRFRRRQNPPE